MKKIVLVLFVVVSFASFANAQHIGPATPVVNSSGGVASPNIGVGYSFIQSDWAADDISGDVEVEQNQVYAHIGAVFGDQSTPNYEVYARIGMSDFEADYDVDGGSELMFAVGLRNEFYQGQVFGIGGVLQTSYIDSFSDNLTINWQGNDYRVRASLKEIFAVELGIPVQVKAGNNALFYLGPVVYFSTADLDVTILNNSFSVDVDENRNVGVFGGLAWRAGKMSFEVEGKYKSDFSVSGFFSFVF